LEKLALEMTRLCPGHPEPWMMLARAGDAQKRLDKCLAAIDQAIARQARFVAAHEYRADLLARASRYDEALAACSPPAFGDQPPMILQGRAATIRWESGRRDEAIAAMSKLLVAHPNYHWGSVRLLQWLEASKQWDNLLAGARRHQQTFPNDGIGYGFAASALRQQRQLPAAIQELNQAAAKDKGYAFAVEDLVRLHLQAGEWTQGLEVLDAYGARVKPGWVAYFRVLLTAGRKDRNAFIAAVEVLAARDDWTHADFPGFKQRLVRAGWLNLFENTLRKQLHARHGSAMAARTCVRLRVERGDWSLRAMERELEAQLRIFQEALSQYLFQVANSRQTYKVLRRVLQKHRMILQSFPQAWGNAAACLVKFDRYADTVAWMTNWRERPDVPLWTLLNLVHALLGLRQFAQAEALAEEVLAKSARQQGTDDLEACVAFLRALGGRPEAAAVNRRAVQNPSAPGYTAFLCVLTDAMLAASGDNPAQRRAGVRQQIRQWRKLLHQVQQYHQLLYAVCSRSALNLLRRQVPGSVRWRDRWAVTALFRRAWLWRVGFYLRT
jgi:tetratricopeptide (TPR) repeat protein